jgi:hypothetical protein
MQKVVGSSPIIRFLKPPHLRGFRRLKGKRGSGVARKWQGCVAESSFRIRRPRVFGRRAAWAALQARPLSCAVRSFSGSHGELLRTSPVLTPLMDDGEINPILYEPAATGYQPALLHSHLGWGERASAQDSANRIASRAWLEHYSRSINRSALVGRGSSQVVGRTTSKSRPAKARQGVAHQPTAASKPSFRARVERSVVWPQHRRPCEHPRTPQMLTVAFGCARAQDRLRNPTSERCDTEAHD